MEQGVRLQVRIDEGYLGRPVFLLTDAEGRALPMQVSAKIENGVDEKTMLTVTFVVDGELIRLAPSA